MPGLLSKASSISAVHWGLVGVLAATVFLYLVDFGAMTWSLQNLIYLVATALPVVVGWPLVQRFGWRTRTSLPIFFLWLGFAMLAVGEWLWVYYEWGLGIDPFPSLADLFYLSAYPAFLIGLAEFARAEFASVKVKLGARLIGTVSILVLVSGLILYLGVYQAASAGVNQLELVMSAFYSLADIVIVGLVGFLSWLAWKMKGGRLQRVLLQLAASFSFTLVADVLFLAFSSSYTPGSWIWIFLDILWVAGYLLAAASFLSWSQLIQRVSAQLRALT